MKGFIFTLLLVLSALSFTHGAPPAQPPFWPFPESFSGAKAVSSPAIINKQTLKFQNIGPSSTLLNAAFLRYQDYIFFKSDTVGKNSFTLQVKVQSQDETLNSTTDESYSLQSNSSWALLEAPTVYGALRGLETFSQMIYYDTEQDHFSIPWALPVLHDTPHFNHRGLLIDTARHYLDQKTILKAIDALSFTKMNVLHWHMVDAESFPLMDPKVPLLSKGAYNPKAIYTSQVVSEVVAYAQQRGVRVIVEYDTPGHSDSWGKGYPNIVAKCPSWSSNINNVPLNPARNETLKIVEQLFTSVSSYVLDDFWHIGGDEVVYQCFAQDPSIQAWMKEHNYGTNFDHLMSYYEHFLWDLFSKSKLDKTMIAWEEVFTEYGLQSQLPKDLIIEVWKDETTLLSVAEAGLRGILAYPWYLDHRGDNWLEFYNQKVFNSPQWTSHLKEKVIGGEVAAWAEYLNQFTFETQVNTRLFAVGERLYGGDGTFPDVQDRLTAFLCSAERRGIHSSPIAPGYCFLG